eukprot:scaffold268874_cov29-Prasinocladus_malaysianus.AAC.2
MVNTHPKAMSPERPNPAWQWMYTLPPDFCEMRSTTHQTPSQSMIGCVSRLKASVAPSLWLPNIEGFTPRGVQRP